MREKSLLVNVRDTKPEELFHRMEVGISRDKPGRQERSWLRGEQVESALFRIAEGLDAEPVPREEKALMVAVDNRERKHSVEMGQAFEAPLLVCVKDDLCVARARKTVPEVAQLIAKLDVVEDLAIVDDSAVRVRALHGLVRSGLESEDGEAAAPKDRRREPRHSLRIWAAVLHVGNHRRDRLGQGLDLLVAV